MRVKCLDRIVCIISILVISIGFIGCGKVTYVNQEGYPLVVGDYDYTVFTGDYDYTVFREYDYYEEDKKKMQELEYAGIVFEYESYRGNIDFPKSIYKKWYMEESDAREAFNSVLKQLEEDYKTVAKHEYSYAVHFDDGVVVSVRLYDEVGYNLRIMVAGDKNFEKIKQEQ